MKKSLILITLLLMAAAAFAQKRNDLYAELGCSRVGGSVTFDWRLNHRWELGGGVNAYDWRTNRINVRTAVYADMRAVWEHRRAVLFVPFDLGIAFYSEREQPPYTILSYSRAGVHFAVGIGCCFKLTRRGGGPYATFAMKGYEWL